MISDSDPAFGLPPGTPASSTPGWMITFADLLSLLLSFFVLMFATTSIDRRDWTRVMLPVTLYFGGHPDVVPGPAGPTPPAAAAIDMNYLGAALRQLAAQDANLAGAEVTTSDHRATLSLPPGLVPCGGTPIAPKRLAGLAAVLGNIDNRIEVTGRSGIDPTRNAAASDWGRALDAAQAVARSLAAAGVTRTIAASGRADLPGGRGACAVDIVLRDDADPESGGGIGH